jgi:hypothetical protein
MAQRRIRKLPKISREACQALFLFEEAVGRSWSYGRCPMDVMVQYVRGMCH